MGRKRANGEGTILKRAFKRKDGSTFTRYSARITLGTDPTTGKPAKLEGPQRKTQSEARDDLRSLTLAKEQQRLEPQKITVATYLDYWLKSHGDEVRPRTRSTYDSLIRTHLVPRIGTVKLAELTPLQCQELQQNVAKAISPATARKCRQCLHAALEQALRWELINRNPLSLVKAISAPRAELNKWTAEEAKRFLSIAKSDRYHALFHLALAGGLRAGELLGLQWTDLTGRVLFIQRQMSTVGSPDLVPPKTAKSFRKLALDDLTLSVLKAHAKRQTERERASGLIFPASNGQPLRLENLRNRHFLPLIEEAGVPRIRIHDLRHMAASTWVKLGLDVAEVSRRMGHSRNSTTLDVYVTAQEAPEVKIIDIQQMYGIEPQPERPEADEDEAA